MPSRFIEQVHAMQAFFYKPTKTGESINNRFCVWQVYVTCMRNITCDGTLSCGRHILDLLPEIFLLADSRLEAVLPQVLALTTRHHHAPSHPPSHSFLQLR